jgi:hypothetical protein
MTKEEEELARTFGAEELEMIAKFLTTKHQRVSKHAGACKRKYKKR